MSDRDSTSGHAAAQRGEGLTGADEPALVTAVQAGNTRAFETLVDPDHVDGRSDLFSLAVTLYHLLTGNQPFAGDSLPELKRNILGEEPDLNHLTLPAGITEVIIKALQKKPYMRFADAQQMLTSVEYCENQLRERMKQFS